MARFTFAFGDRISKLEAQAKSDLCSLTGQISDLRTKTQNDIGTQECYRLCYNMQLDMAKAILDPKKHRSDILPSQKVPKLSTETQMLMNLMDWQVKMCCTYSQQENLKRMTDKYLDSAKHVKREKVKFDKYRMWVRAPLIGRKIERRHSIDLFNPVKRYYPKSMETIDY